ncbi:hypothetical protein LWC34_39560 [Kibdelosporangium philippinense]|uniref:WYL domain-containing protein n=1 Tax=Kibdelosporangium philippinense TaxID=211113 RepID=A0ABS8ZMR7_9PSEU|nr:hypothetical protein [Kibdelosporangium philippinense]MCE7008867.1 hypothetical protein [Kibdelosporangium philippinense]
MPRQYRYYAIVGPQRTVDSPSVVVREWDAAGGDTSEEMFSTDLEWVRSNILYRIGSGRDISDAVPISAEAATRFESIQADRVRLERERERELKSRQYRYYAVLGGEYTLADDPLMVVREWATQDGDTHEEMYSSAREWVPSDLVSHMRSGQASDIAVPISLDMVRKFGLVQAERERHARRLRDQELGREYRYFAVVGAHDSLDNPHAVVRQWDGQDGQTHEERFAKRLDWVPSDLTYRISVGAESEPFEVIAVDMVAADRFEGVQQERVWAEERHDPSVAEYNYFAIVDAGHPVDDPLTVIREFGGVEQEYTHAFRWDGSTWRYRIGLRQLASEAVPITAEAAKQFETVQRARFLRAHGLEP